MSHITLQPRFLLVSGAAAPDVLLEPGKILAHRDIQIPFKTTIGESAQNYPGPGPYLFFFPPAGGDGLCSHLCVTTCPSPSLLPSLPRLQASASGLVVKLDLHPDALAPLLEVPGRQQLYVAHMPLCCRTAKYVQSALG